MKVHPDRPCNTVTKNDGNITMHGLMHWAEQRRFTVGEYKRFQSFPDDFQFVGTYTDAVQRIGNSVPPLFMKRVAEHIYDRILNTHA
jgi:DNA (cytosine-5)-methyltransferase 1